MAKLTFVFEEIQFTKFNSNSNFSVSSEARGTHYLSVFYFGMAKQPNFPRCVKVRHGKFGFISGLFLADFIF